MKKRKMHHKTFKGWMNSKGAFCKYCGKMIEPEQTYYSNEGRGLVHIRCVECHEDGGRLALGIDVDVAQLVDI